MREACGWRVPASADSPGLRVARAGDRRPEARSHAERAWVPRTAVDGERQDPQVGRYGVSQTGYSVRFSMEPSAADRL